MPSVNYTTVWPDERGGGKREDQPRASGHSGHNSFFVKTELRNSRCLMSAMGQENRVSPTHDISRDTDGCRSNPRLALERSA